MPAKQSQSADIHLTLLNLTVDEDVFAVFVRKRMNVVGATKNGSAMLPEIEYENVCPASFCPLPNDPDYHACVNCGALLIEHDHTRGRGKLKDDKRFIVPKCHYHHDRVTLRFWKRKHVEPEASEDGRRHYIEIDENGKTVLDISPDYMQGDGEP